MIMQTISRFLFACVLVIGTIQGSAERNMPIGWGALTAVGLLGSAVAAYKLAKSKNTLKKVRAALKKNQRSMRLQIDEEDAEHGISISALVLTIAGLVSLLGGYKVRAAVLSQQQVASAPSAPRPAAAPELRPGDPGYRETRPGFDSTGERIWPSGPASGPERCKATKRPEGLPLCFGWDSVRKQAFYEAGTGRVYVDWKGE